MITKYEYLKLKERYKKGYRWIARDETNELCIYETKPMRLTHVWMISKYQSKMCHVHQDDHLFQCIKWEDEEPTKIDDLIKDYEAHQLIVGESVKVTVPKFVAEWIEKCKDEDTVLYYAFTNMPDDVDEYLFDGSGDKPFQIFARAWLDGYEIDLEKEKLYYIKFSENQYAQRFDESKIDSILVNDKKLAGRFTEEQIKKINPRFWLLAVEVE